MDQNNFILPPPRASLLPVQRRRKLLPWWVLVFLWMFLLFAAFTPVMLILGLMGKHFDMELLGIRTTDPISIIGIALMLLFAFKGIVAYALWTEKVWAVGIAKIDAIISIAICCLTIGASIFWPGSHGFSLRLELVVLIPYYYKMNQIEYAWTNFGSEPVASE
jgi:hypothetical protein